MYQIKNPLVVQEVLTCLKTMDEWLSPYRSIQDVQQRNVYYLEDLAVSLPIKYCITICIISR